MSSRCHRQLQTNLKSFLDHVNASKNGSSTSSRELEHSSADLLMSADQVNKLYGDEMGTKLVHKALNRNFDLDKFMDRLSQDQIDQVRRVIAKQSGVNLNKLVGGGSAYTLLEIVLCVMFFPFSLIYIFTRD